MKRFKLAFGCGTRRTYIVFFCAESKEEAEIMAEEPNDETYPLHKKIERIMLWHGIDPVLRGWHNYEILKLEETNLLHYKDYYRLEENNITIHTNNCTVQAANKKDALKKTYDWVYNNDPLRRSAPDPITIIEKVVRL